MWLPLLLEGTPTVDGRLLLPGAVECGDWLRLPVFRYQLPPRTVRASSGGQATIVALRRAGPLVLADVRGGVVPDGFMLGADLAEPHVEWLAADAVLSIGRCRVAGAHLLPDRLWPW